MAYLGQLKNWAWILFADCRPS